MEIFGWVALVAAMLIALEGIFHELRKIRSK